MPDYLKDLIPQYLQAQQQQRTAKQGTIDNITKLLSDRVPTPIDMVDILQQSGAPLTTYEVQRGIRRPTPNQVMAASRASQIKNQVDLSLLQEKGIAGAAEDVQTLINGINAQANLNNSTAIKTREVMSTVTQGMSPQEQVLFNNEFLGRLHTAPDGFDPWMVAHETMKAIDPKGKTPFKIEKYRDSNGNTVAVMVDPDSGRPVELDRAPPVPQGSDRPMPVYDPTSSTGGVYVSPRDAMGKQTPPAKVGGYDFTPTGAMVQKAGGPADPDVKLSPNEASSLSQVKVGAEGANDLEKWLFPGGKFDQGKLVKFSAGVLGGGEGRAIFQRAGTGLRHTMYGATLPAAEFANFADAFMPSMTDSEATARAKVFNLQRFLQSDVQFRERARQSGGVRALTPQERDKARAAINAGANRTQVVQRLMDSGVDPSGL